MEQSASGGMMMMRMMMVMFQAVSGEERKEVWEPLIKVIKPNSVGCPRRVGCDFPLSTKYRGTPAVTNAT